MKNIFEVINHSENNSTKGKGVLLGLRLRIGENAVQCPITTESDSCAELESQVENLKEMLDKTLEIARAFLGGDGSDGTLLLEGDMSPEEIWKVLSGESEELLFVNSFNAVDEAKRREVADYVLSNCNTFSGKGAVFSARYDNESGLII